MLNTSIKLHCVVLGLYLIEGKLDKSEGDFQAGFFDLASFISTFHLNTIDIL